MTVSLLPDLVKPSTTCALGLIRAGKEGCWYTACREQRLLMAVSHAGGVRMLHLPSGVTDSISDAAEEERNWP